MWLHASLNLQYSDLFSNFSRWACPLFPFKATLSVSCQLVVWMQTSTFESLRIRPDRLARLVAASWPAKRIPPRPPQLGRMRDGERVLPCSMDSLFFPKGGCKPHLPQTDRRKTKQKGQKGTARSGPLPPSQARPSMYGIITVTVDTIYRLPIFTPFMLYIYINLWIFMTECL